jgi:hypothetical protein
MRFKQVRLCDLFSPHDEAKGVIGFLHSMNRFRHVPPGLKAVAVSKALPTPLRDRSNRASDGAACDRRRSCT